MRRYVWVLVAGVLPMGCVHETAPQRAMRALDGQAVVLNIDFSFVRVGRSLAKIRELSLGSPFPEAERLRLATAIAARMAGP
jgi:hypothetical protein